MVGVGEGNDVDELVDDVVEIMVVAGVNVTTGSYPSGGHWSGE